jgi:hypothetical protein
MNTLKTLLAASAIALSFGGAALASDASEAGNPGMLLFQNGTMTSVKVGSKMHAMIMEHATPFTGAIYASAGRLYTVENVKMASGHMLYDTLSPSSASYTPDINR